MTLVDATGQPWTGPRVPRRIVSLIPSITETLFVLGVGDAVVGVTAYCVEPRDGVSGKAKVGGEKNPKLELIRELAPDLVVANIEENLREHVETLRDWGIPVWVTYPRTVVEGIQMIRDLGALTGSQSTALALAAALDEQLADARGRAASHPPVAVFYPIWRRPYMTVNRDTYVHDMLAVCGARNVFADRRERYPEVSLDEVAAAQPDVIVLPDEPFRFREVHLQDFASYGTIPAVRTRRIHLVDGKPFCWYGPRIGDALRTLPRLFG